MSWLDGLSTALTAGTQGAAGWLQGQAQGRKEAEERAKELAATLRQKRIDEQNALLQNAQIGHLGAQSAALMTPKPATPLTHLPENSLIPDGKGGWMRAVPDATTQYEERPEQGGVAIYEGGKFKTWKIRPPSEKDTTGRDAQLLSRSLARESKLSTDYQQNPVVKNAYGMANAISQIRATAQTVNNPQGDIDIIYQVVKLRDPNSAVREGEINIQTAARSLGTKVAMAWQKAKSGRMLTPQERSEIVGLLDTKTEAARRQLAPIKKMYGERARRFGADSAAVAVDPFEEAGVTHVANPYLGKKP